MHLDGTAKARATDAVTEGIGNAGLGSQALTILTLQDVVIWTPSRIFEKSEEGAESRKRGRPFAFCGTFVALYAGYRPGDFVRTA